MNPLQCLLPPARYSAPVAVRTRPTTADELLVGFTSSLHNLSRSCNQFSDQIDEIAARRSAAPGFPSLKAPDYELGPIVEIAARLRLLLGPGRGDELFNRVCAATGAAVPTIELSTEASMQRVPWDRVLVESLSTGALPRRDSTGEAVSVTGVGDRTCLAYLEPGELHLGRPHQGDWGQGRRPLRRQPARRVGLPQPVPHQRYPGDPTAPLPSRRCCGRDGQHRSRRLRTRAGASRAGAPGGSDGFRRQHHQHKEAAGASTRTQRAMSLRQRQEVQGVLRALSPPRMVVSQVTGVTRARRTPERLSRGSCPGSAARSPRAGWCRPR